MIKRLFKSLLLGLLAFMMFSGVALASWAYIFPASVFDTSNTTRANCPVLLGYGAQNLIDTHMISANATNTNMQVGSQSIKYMMATGNVAAVLPSLPNGGVVAADLYTGYSPEQTVFAIITGHNGYVIVSDSDSLELGDNFTISFSGYFNTDSGTDKNILYKQGAIEVYSSPTVSQNITAGCILSGIPPTTVNLYPNAAGNYTALQPYPVVANYLNVKEVVADDFATTVNTTAAAQTKDAYNLQDWGISNLLVGSVNSVTVVYRHYYVFGGIGQGHAQPYLRLGVDETAGTLVTSAHDAWTTTTELLARPGGGVWTYNDINNLQVAIGLDSTGGGVHYEVLTQIYVIVNYTPKVSVSIVGVISGNHTVTVSDNTTTLSMQIDALAPVTVAMIGYVFPNSNNYTMMQNDVMPYADNITISINGTPQLYLAPNTMIIGTNIPDRSLNSHNGTIVWGSNSGITLSYGEMTSYSSYTASTNVTSGYSMPSAPLPRTWFASGENASALPFYDSFSEVAVQVGIPVQTFYAWGVMGVAFGAFVGLAAFTRSALIAYIAMVAVFAFGSGMTIIPAWIVFVMIIVGTAIFYLYRQVAY